jgi:hypothetical protein
MLTNSLHRLAKRLTLLLRSDYRENVQTCLSIPQTNHRRRLNRSTPTDGTRTDRVNLVLNHCELATFDSYKERCP